MLKKQKLWKIYFRTLLLSFLFLLYLAEARTFFHWWNLPRKKLKVNWIELGRGGTSLYRQRKFVQKPLLFVFSPLSRGERINRPKLERSSPTTFWAPSWFWLALLYTLTTSTRVQSHTSAPFILPVVSLHRIQQYSLSLTYCDYILRLYVLTGIVTKEFQTYIYPHYCLEPFKVICRNMSSTKHVNWLRLNLFQHEMILKCELSRESNSFLCLSIISQSLTLCEKHINISELFSNLLSIHQLCAQDTNIAH